MAWDEWEQLKASAAERQSTQMQLNRVPDEDRVNSGIGEGGDLKTDQKDLAAVGDEAFKLYHRLKGHTTIDGLDSTATDLDTQGFALGKALQHVSIRWDKQVNSLLDACALISNHMEFSNKTHQENEDFIARHVSSIDTLDKGFDESYAPPGEKNTVYTEKNKKDEKD